MSSPRDDFIKLLKTNGQSLTRARLGVFEALLGQEPLSMQQLANRVPKADRASVYRAIELFERLGIVQRLHTGWKYKLELTDKFATHHHHLTCLGCGRVLPMNEDALEQVIAKLAAAHHFTPSAHQIELQGYCQECAVPSLVS
ncbi:MAG TPA: Fur family transcriptional regulator [Bacillota bacterium]|nr:Fur family transcriptional regulator [Bacillota bacterium]